MSSLQAFLPYTKGLDVGVDEFLHRHAFNRSAARLLQNDTALSGAYERYLVSMNVFEYSDRREYRQNDLVWVKRSFGDFKLFLVRRVLDGKAEGEPSLQEIVDRAYVDGAGRQPDPEFDRYGWKDENRYLDVDDYKTSDKLRRYAGIQFADHEASDTYHRFGQLLGDGRQPDEKLLLADLSNANRARDKVFYPYYTRRLEPDDVVLYGFYRVWDTGVLEVDVVYRLGYVGRQDSGGYESDVLKCNDFSMAGVQYSNSDSSRFFSTAKDRDIFAPESGGESHVDDIVQTGRNGYVNVYSARVRFPRFRLNGKFVQFRDGQYMIFGSDVMSQDADVRLGAVEPGANCMAYCDKSKSGFTALYVTYPDKEQYGKGEEYNARNGGLVSNSFHCHVVGRWVEEPVQI